MEVVEKYRRKDRWGKMRTFSRTVWVEPKELPAPTLGRVLGVIWMIGLLPIVFILSGLNAIVGWF